MTEGATIVHAYGVVGAGQRVPEVSGIGGAPVHVVEASRLSVVVSNLSADDYGTASWDEHADDLRWLGSVAREHQQVLEHLIAVGDVLPFRLPSMYSGVEALRTRLEEDMDFLESALAAISGRVEWGVKVYRDTSASDRGHEQTDAIAGADYLRSRAQELRDREDADSRLRRVLCEMHERLTRISDDAVRNPVQDSALSGRTEPMVLNGAYLVHRERQQQFVKSVQTLAEDRADHGLLVESTGPWPAYNFVGAPSAAAHEQ